MHGGSPTQVHPHLEKQTAALVWRACASTSQVGRAACDGDRILSGRRWDHIWRLPPIHPLGDIDDGVLRGIFLRAIQTADNDAIQSIELSRLIGFTMHLVALRRPWARGIAGPPMRLSRFKRVEMPCRPRPPSSIRDTTIRVAAVGIRQPHGVAHKAGSHPGRQKSRFSTQAGN